jgi:hypothetical protein
MIKNNLSLLVQATYLGLVGVLLIYAPNFLLGLLGFEPTTEIWIKVLGIVTLALATVYSGIVRSGDLISKRYSVYGRLMAVIGFILLVLVSHARSAMFLLAGVDLATAIWSWMELKKTR